MTQTSSSQLAPQWTPLSFVEEFAEDEDWTAYRVGKDELVIECPGSWSNYYMTLVDMRVLNTLRLSLSFHIQIPDDRREAVYELLSFINDRLWLGHFDLTDEDYPTFRHTLLLPDNKKNQERIIEEVILVAQNECERFYPVFQFVIWGAKDPLEAFSAALIDTMGEA